MAEPKNSLKKGMLSSALIKNPVLFEAVGLSPVLAMTTSLKSAIMLITASCVELIFIELFACLALKKVKRWLRMPIYALLGVLLNLPVFAFFNYIAPNESLYVGIFLPLIAVNSLIALHCERYAVKHSLKSTFIDAVFASVGYALVILLVSVVREIIGNGTIYSVDLHFPVKLSGMLLPFGGFLVLGFLAAIIKAILAKVVPDAHPERAFSMQEISQSHLDSFKSLLDTEFNPYADEEDETETTPRTKKAEKPKKEKTEKPKTEKSKKEKPEKPKKQKEEKAKPQKAETPKKEKSSKPKKEKKVKKASTKVEKPKALSPEEQAQRKAKKEQRTVRDSYLVDFDEILSDLDAYKKSHTDEGDSLNQTSDATEKGGDNQ